MNWTCFVSLKRIKLMAKSITVLWECLHSESSGDRARESKLSVLL